MGDDPKQKTAYAPDPAESISAEEGFFDRWSRLKRSAGQSATRGKQEKQASGSPDVRDQGSAVELEHKAEEVEVEHKSDEDMPSLESLDERSDYGQFFSPEVSEKLRKAALRKWFSSAMFNVRDGLDDYDEDFRTFAGLGDIVTADMRTQAERKAQQLGATQTPAEAGTEVVPESPQSEELLASTSPEPESAVQGREIDAVESLPQQEQEQAQEPKRDPDTGVIESADAPKPQPEPQEPS